MGSIADQVAEALKSATGVKVLVSSGIKRVVVTKALAAAGDYAANDVLSESATVGTAWKFEGMGAVLGGSGSITKAMAILETTALTPRILLYLFRVPPTSALNDNVANTALLHADLGDFLGWIEFDAMETLNAGDSIAIATPSTDGNVPLEYDCVSGDDAIYGVAVTRDAITGEVTSDELTFILFTRQD